MRSVFAPCSRYGVQRVWRRAHLPGLGRRRGREALSDLRRAGTARPFVRDQVQPKLWACRPMCGTPAWTRRGVDAIEAFLRDDPDPEIIANWPDDVRLFCQALMISPGRTAPTACGSESIASNSIQPRWWARSNTRLGGTRWRFGKGSSVRRRTHGEAGTSARVTAIEYFPTLS